jgi:hypothetical protein
VRFSVEHNGVPIGFVELDQGELVAGRLVPLPTLDSLRDTLRAGSRALLALGFFGAATPAGQNGAGDALRAAAALQFDLLDDRGEFVPTTFVNLIEAPDNEVVVLTRFGHAHAMVGARVRTPRRAVPEDEQPPASEGNAPG